MGTVLNTQTKNMTYLEERIDHLGKTIDVIEEAFDNELGPPDE